jgi:hypothetical protein
MAERSPEIEKRIIDGLSVGTPLAVLCRESGMPHRSSVYDWMDEDEDLARRIARARDLGFDAIAAECLEIADTQEMGEIVTEKPLMVDGKPLDGVSVREVKQEDMLGHRRLRIETRLKLLAKWDPKRYGDLIKHSGPDGSSPITTVQITAEMTPAQAAEAYSLLMG